MNDLSTPLAHYKAIADRAADSVFDAAYLAVDRLDETQMLELARLMFEGKFALRWSDAFEGATQRIADAITDARAELAEIEADRTRSDAPSFGWAHPDSGSFGGRC